MHGFGQQEQGRGQAGGETQARGEEQKEERRGVTERRGKEMCVDSVPREAALRKGHDHVLHRKWPGPVLVRQQNQEERGVIIAKCEV